MKRRKFFHVTAVASTALLTPLLQRTSDSTTTTPSPTHTRTPIATPTPHPTATASPTQSVSILPRVTIPGSEFFDLVSRINGETYRIFVFVPKPIQPARLPVVYMTDGNGNFGLVNTMYRQLLGEKYVPPAILVGIGYPLDYYDEYKGLRGRDFTPTVLSPNSAYASEFPVGSGGAGKFLRVLREEVKPLIDSKYPTNPNDATVIGHSLGGLFTLYTLLHDPTLFQRYVIGSPSIWYDNKSIVRDVSLLANQTNLKARVYMGAGQAEQYMIEPMVEFADKLKSYRLSGLTLSQEIFQDETHLSVIPFFISHGLRAVFRQA